MTKLRRYPLTCIAAAISAVLLAAAPIALAQPPDQDATPASSRDAELNDPPQRANEAQMPASGEATREEIKTFSGRIEKENGEVILKDPVTKVIYKLSDTSKAKQYVGKTVKVTGKRDSSTNIIQVQRIEPTS